MLPDFTYVVVPREYLKELYSAPEDIVSFNAPVVESLAVRYTFQDSVADNQYHVAVVRTDLNRHLPEIMPEILDEVQAAMADHIPLTDGTIILKVVLILV